MFKQLNAAVALSALVAACGFAACGSSDEKSGDTKAQKNPGDTAGKQLPAIKKDAALNKLLPARIRSAGKVRVAADIPYAPFVMYAKEGSDEITGLDYDLGQAIGDRLGVDFDFKQQKFDGILPGLQARKYDIAMADMSDNAERRRVVDFVDYLSSGTGIMVKQGNPAGIKTYMDLCGKSATLQSGAAQVEYVETWQKRCKKAGKPEIDVKLLPKAPDSQLALTTGKADGYVTDIPGAAYQAKTVGGGTAFQVLEDPAAVGGYAPVPAGIAILKGNEQLVGAIQKALQSLMDDGSYKQVLDKYALGSTAIPKATVNDGN